MLYALSVVAALMPNAAHTTDRMAVTIADCDPHDRIYVTNTGECDTVTGRQHIDFTPSKGKILIGTKLRFDYGSSRVQSRFANSDIAQLELSEGACSKPVDQDGTPTS